MDIVLFVLGFALLLGGLAGSVLPVLPGPPLGWAGLLLISFTDKVEFSTQLLIVSGIVAIVITALDYMIPVWGTKRFGGTKAGIRGSTIGLFIGLFFGPLGIILGPALGAFVGEMTVKNDTQRAMKSALGSFIGFLMGSGLKLIFGAWAMWKAIASLF